MKIKFAGKLVDLTTIDKTHCWQSKGEIKKYYWISLINKDELGMHYAEWFESKFEREKRCK